MELSLINLAKHLADGAAWALVGSIRWPDDPPACPHCGVIDDAYFIEPKKLRTGKVGYRRPWKYGDCGKLFSAPVGTIFEDFKIPLSK